MTDITASPRRALDNPYLLLVLASLSWAGNTVASRVAVGEVSPMALTSLRWAGALVLLPLLARRSLAHDWPVLRRRWRYVLVMGTLGFTAFNAFYYVAAHYTSAVNLGIIQGSIPGLVFLIAYALRGTRARPAQVAGMAATLVGVAVLATKGDPTTLAGLSFNAGDLMMLVSCLVYAIYTVLLPDRPRVAGLSFFAGLSAAAVLTSLPLLAGEIALGAFLAPSAVGWAAVAYCAVFPSVIAQICYMRGVELIGPGRAGVFVNLVPVFAAVAAVALLGEEFHGYHAAALALVLGGILFAERVGRPART